MTVTAVLRLATRFPAAISEDQFDALEEEVLDYVLSSSNTIPSVPRAEGKPTNLCAYWQELGQMQGENRFPVLVSLSKCLLSLPISNADTERVFSIVRKIIIRKWNRILCVLF